LASVILPALIMQSGTSVYSPHWTQF